MTLVRIIALLGGAFAVMLTVVVLRAEITHMEYLTSQLDQRSELLIEQIREQELELARLRNPALIRDRVAELRLTGEGPGPAEPAARGKRP